VETTYLKYLIKRPRWP